MDRYIKLVLACHVNVALETFSIRTAISPSAGCCPSLSPPCSEHLKTLTAISSLSFSLYLSPCHSDLLFTVQPSIIGFRAHSRSTRH